MKRFSVILIFFVTLQSRSADLIFERMSDINFTPDKAVLSQGHIQYYFEVLQKVTTVDDKVFAQLLPLDINETFKQAASENTKVNVLITKSTYILNKDISFFTGHALDISYWRETRPELGLEKSTQSSPDPHKAEFDSTGSRWVPQSKLSLAIYDTQTKSQEINGALDLILSMDSPLGLPTFLMSEDYTNFGKKLGSKTSLESRTFSKYYSAGTGKTLVVAYTLVYTYNLLPKLFGGIEAMRKLGLNQNQTIIEAINRF